MLHIVYCEPRCRMSRDLRVVVKNLLHVSNSMLGNYCRCKNAYYS